MKVRSAVLLTALLAAASAGCANAAQKPAGPSQSAHPVTASVPYDLYTHCGIDEANIGGRWFEADHPLSDGNGNPPAGWGNPDQPGTITMLSPTSAEFRDSLGHAVRFHLLAGATGPKHMCSLRRRPPVVRVEGVELLVRCRLCDVAACAEEERRNDTTGKARSICSWPMAARQFVGPVARTVPGGRLRTGSTGLAW